MFMLKNWNEKYQNNLLYSVLINFNYYFVDKFFFLIGSYQTCENSWLNTSKLQLNKIQEVYDGGNLSYSKNIRNLSFNLADLIQCSRLIYYDKCLKGRWVMVRLVYNNHSHPHPPILFVFFDILLREDV